MESAAILTANQKKRRIIFITNKVGKKLPQIRQKLISKGQFREDIHFRIGIIPIHLPHIQTDIYSPASVQQNPIENERKNIMQALTASGRNKSEAARLLGVSRVTLWKRLKKHQIEVDKNIRE